MRNIRRTVDPAEVLPLSPTPARDAGGFLDMTSLFVLAIAEVHGVRVADIKRRRTLVLAVILGDSGAKVVEKSAGRTGPYWAGQIRNPSDRAPAPD